MKLGTDSSKKTAFAIGLFVVALFLTIRMLSSGPSTSEASTAAAAPATRPVAKTATARRAGRTATGKTNPEGPAPPNLDPRLRLDALKATEGVEYSGTGRNIFTSQAEEAPKIEKPVAQALLDKNKPPTPASTPVYTPPPPPPINLKFFGVANQVGSPKKVLLSSGEDIFVASEGDVVQRRYKIIKINQNSVEVQDVLSNNRQTIPLSAG